MSARCTAATRWRGTTAASSTRRSPRLRSRCRTPSIDEGIQGRSEPMAVMRSPGPSLRRAERVGGASGLARSADAAAGKKKVSAAAAWREARDLLRTHKYRLLLGLALMLVSRLAGLVLPASSKYLVDEVITKGRHELLLPIAVAGGIATA